MTDSVNSFRLSMTYQGAQATTDPKLQGITPIGETDAAGTVAASSASDQILDLSDQSRLADELSHQDLSQVKVIKVGKDYLALPGPEVLKGLVAQLKNVCLDKAGKLRKDFQYIDFAARTNQAVKPDTVTTSLVLNVVGPEPNDGYLNTSHRDMIGGLHLIQPGDSLVNIARLLYGGSEGQVLANAQRLANFNHFSDPNKIPAGKNLYLIDDNFLTAISSKPPRLILPGEGPSVIDQVVDAPPTAPAAEDALPAAPVGRGAEIYSESPPSVDGLLRFIGKDAYDLIKNYEKTVPKMYWDGGKAGKGYPTIGVGHLIQAGEKLNGKSLMTATLSDKEIEKLFLTDLSEHLEPLVDHLKPEVLHELNRNQLLALASLAYNIGPGGTDKKGHKLGFKYSPVVTALNGPGTLEERLQKAQAGFARHIFSKGQRLAGLVDRRLGERTLFLRPDAKSGDIPAYDKPKLKAYIDQLNQDDSYPDVGYADMWPAPRPKAAKPKKK